MKYFAILILLVLPFTSCELLEDSSDSSSNIAAGLREALVVGTDTAVSKLAVNDGYLRDEAVKILLPDEMEEKIEEFKAIDLEVVSGEDVYALVLQPIEDDLIKGINRAAESAATEAAPIFVDAITSMSIQDANNILFGSDSAATAYLRENTYTALFETYEPKIDAAIENVKVGNKSVESLYADFVNAYNKELNKDVAFGLTVGDLAGVETLSEPDLSTFATNEGLDGLFLKIKEEEKNIREDPLARVTNLLQSVFGRLD